MPKLLEPPRRATQRSLFSFSFASTTWPLESTTSKFTTLSHTEPCRPLKLEIPPKSMDGKSAKSKS